MQCNAMIRLSRCGLIMHVCVNCSSLVDIGLPDLVHGPHSFDPKGWKLSQSWPDKI